MATRDLLVDGMDCGGCEQSITKALLQVPGVAGATADHGSGAVHVEGDPLDDVAIERAIEDAGYAVRR